MNCACCCATGLAFLFPAWPCTRCRWSPWEGCQSRARALRVRTWQASTDMPASRSATCWRSPAFAAASRTCTPWMRSASPSCWRWALRCTARPTTSSVTCRSTACTRALDSVAASSRWQLAVPQPATVADLRLPSRLASYLDALLARVADPAAPLVSLLAVTGSGARGKYQHGWSDLDVLALADQDVLGRLRTVLNELAGQLGGVKLGFTILSAAECATGAVTPRLLHT